MTNMLISEFHSLTYLGIHKKRGEVHGSSPQERDFFPYLRLNDMSHGVRPKTFFIVNSFFIVSLAEFWCKYMENIVKYKMIFDKFFSL